MAKPFIRLIVFIFSFVLLVELYLMEESLLLKSLKMIQPSAEFKQQFNEKSILLKEQIQRHFGRIKTKYVNAHDYKYILNPEYSTCGRQKEMPDKVLLVAFVTISPQESVRRKIIRTFLRFI